MGGRMRKVKLITRMKETFDFEKIPLDRQHILEQSNLYIYYNAYMLTIYIGSKSVVKNIRNFSQFEKSKLAEAGFLWAL